MFSERRRAQLGVVSVCTLMVLCLGILYQGSRDAALTPAAKSSVAVVAPSQAPILASLGK